MKLSLGFLALTAAQDAAKDDGSDRWGYYDYHIPYDGKIGHAVSGYKGGHEGNRRYCHATLDTQKVYRWDASIHGYFSQFNPVECVGEELFCHIEERAHFGQVIGIRAGCAQMMNHPQVSTAAPITLKPELKNHYNQEAARGATFQQTTNPVSIYYGIGGCLALPAQNGYDTYHADWQAAMEKNYFLGTHGGYGQNQCLRFQRNEPKTDLLPFGVSVCRACCVATNDYFSFSGSNNGSAEGPCNFWRYGAASNPTNVPNINDDGSDFDCYEADTTACTISGNTCTICHKQMFPDFSMYYQPYFDTYHNLFKAFCPDGENAKCTPEGDANQQIIGGGR